jgi:hypothetical protein
MRLSGFPFCTDFYFSLDQKLNNLLSVPVHWNGYPQQFSCLRLTQTFNCITVVFLTQVLKSMTGEVYRFIYLYGATLLGTDWTVWESNPGGGRDFPHQSREALGPI